MFTTRNVQGLVRRFSKFIPLYETLTKSKKADIKKFLNTYDNLLILTGAGVSTESGIPDYRSEKVGLFARSSYKPIQYNEFLNNRSARIRYWARNYVAWPNFHSLSPNRAHFFITYLQQFPGKVVGLITQNVDGLHHKAGSKDVIELHGNSYWVKCLGCDAIMSRFDFQEILKNLNPNWTATGAEIKPDGDIEIDSDKVNEFVVPDCEHCGGILKPTVVFFGDNVPEKRVKKVKKLVEECDAMLILGTSLSTQSSYRIVTQAYDLNKYICIVNMGPTRADKMANLIIKEKCSEVFPDVDNSG